ncbi:MAG: GNAT family N-acetyltransferase [Actinobacteria bacterium]|nr:GNAT family N-acetyltransferase [Actinomycetota bacterium]
MFGLTLRTERLVLRPPVDSELAELAAVARRGVHDPDVRPFGNLWTERPEDQWDSGFVQYFWAQRATWKPDAWDLPFAVYLDGNPVGVQQLRGLSFRIVRDIGTGSWLSRELQGKGIGTEMRAAVLSFAFSYLGAELAHSGAYLTQQGWIGVSRKLGYRENGHRRDRVADAASDAILFRLTRENWFAQNRPVVEVEGLAPCLPLLGLTPDDIPAAPRTA